MYLWVDYGTSQIGIAVADMGIALPYDILDSSTFFAKLPSLIEARKIQTIVVGVAIGYDPYGKQYQVFQSFIDRVRQAVPDDVAIVEQDEDLTTFEAQEALGQVGGKDHLDDVAASIILQRYLDESWK